MPITKSRLARLVPLAVVASLALAAFPGAAAAAECPAQPTTKVFASFGDLNDYFLAPGGDFEGPLSWQRAGEVAREDAEKPWDIAGRKGLVFESAGHVTSPELCVSPLHPHLRFLASARTATGTLRVDAVSANGTVTSLARLDPEPFRGWALSPEVPLAGALVLDEDGTVHVRLRFTAESGGWVIDAVEVDPYQR